MGNGETLPRSHPASEPAGDARALAASPEGVNASLAVRLAGCVVLELVLRQLEAHQMLKRRIRNRAADGRIGERIDRCLSIARLARPSEDAANVVRKRRDRAIDAYRRLDLGLGMDVASREVEDGLADLFRSDGLTALQSNVEIGNHDLARRSGIPPKRSDDEGRSRHDVVAGILTRGSDLRDRGCHIDRSRVGASGWIEQGDVARAGSAGQCVRRTLEVTRSRHHPLGR